jgi:hypothetical protein
VLQDDGATVPLTIPHQTGETDLAVKEVKIAGRRNIVCRNEEEARKDAETRAKLLAGLPRKLAGGAKSLVANTGYRRFLGAPEGDGFAIDPAKVEADAQFDGVFVLRTSLSMSALRWCCAIGTCWRGNRAFSPRKPCSPHARYSTAPAPRSAGISSAPSWPWCYGRNCSTAWPLPAEPCRNGSASSTIWSI